MPEPRDDDDERLQEPRRRPGPPPRRQDDEYEEDRPRRRRPDDEWEEEPPRRRQRGDGHSSRNGMALGGYYCGFLALIFSLGGFAAVLLVITNAGFPGPNPALMVFLTLGVIYGMGGLSALLGIIFSSVGLARVKYSNRGTGHAVTGLVLSILVILGLIVILLLGALRAGPAQRF